MDGEALAAAFASCPGVNCLRDVLPKFGQRLKVYNALKAVFEEFQVCFEGMQFFVVQEASPKACIVVVVYLAIVLFYSPCSDQILFFFFSLMRGHPSLLVLSVQSQ